MVNAATKSELISIRQIVNSIYNTISVLGIAAKFEIKNMSILQNYSITISLYLRYRLFPSRNL